jgi:hypothetical protein
MSYLEHEPEKAGGCGCPSCDLYNVYLKADTEFKSRKAYRTFEYLLDGLELEDKINELQKDGYELVYVIPGPSPVVVMRSVPPMAPSAVDIIQEIKKREATKDNDNAAVKNLEDFEPTGTLH